MSCEKNVEQKEGYRVECGTTAPNGETVVYSMTTDDNQGICYTKTKCIQYCHGTSMELCGTKITDEVTPAKTIDAANGDIHIRAQNGAIFLEAPIIHLMGIDGKSAHIIIQSSDQIILDAPTTNIQTTNFNVAAANTANVAGTNTTFLGNVSAEVQSGIDIDKSSVIGKILDAITRFKNFFSSICEDKPKG